MARDAKSEQAENAVAPPKKSKKLLVIILAGILVIVLIVGGIGAFLIMRNRTAQVDETGEMASEQAPKNGEKAAPGANPVYVALDAFTVNLTPENGDQFLQLVIAAEVRDASVGDQLKVFTPKLRNNVMLLLSSKKASVLLTTEGKVGLANEIRDLMNEVLGAKGKGSEGPIKEVLFTSFIIQ